MKNTLYDVIIIGAGPSGIGTAIALQEMGLKNICILESFSIGESFKRWPKETMFITPSFTSNAFMMPDLNAITPLTSPALQFKKERISGPDYADYLGALVESYQIPVQEGVSVTHILDDPSVILSPNTMERLRAEMVRGNIRIITNATVTHVIKQNVKYEITLASGKKMSTHVQPLLAAGFKTSTILIEEFLNRTESGDVILTNTDEIAKTKNIFLVGPMVHHDDVIFCFIYKNRMRFAVVAGEIATRLGLNPSETIAQYKKYNMYLEDCAQCAGSCNC